MQILGQIGWAGEIREILSLPVFSIVSKGQTAALAHTLNVSNDVFPRKEVHWGVRITGDVIWGKYANENSPTVV